MQARGDRDEVSHHGKEASHERAELAVLGEEPLRARQRRFGQEDVLAVAPQEGPADPVRTVVVGERAASLAALA